ncbi:aminotransferase class I/II-fold pyridoxal phosphate-dependent enzyme [Moraxella nasibovis]|uniref:aminotransferase class I/II-fold pyridoxal phosphate-dependent enzyme n=1 Tax=Moraxella nasibovis TaxID=2904120 RepID=UPI00240ECA15|nr:aminotransferase class I/II-fold pyridoxal phosphate-dependent enzyme [Moraxella nasibovis]WFF39381.1 aminotransferase class I/II-fold pyridoxal phosphate-dependent enzyme [Moraxella nasibovis]
MTNYATHSANTSDQQKMQGIRLKQLRKSLGLSAQKLAQKLSEQGAQVSRGAIANWECGKNGIASNKLSILASVLNTTESYLLTGRHQLVNDKQVIEKKDNFNIISNSNSKADDMSQVNQPLKKSNKLANVCYDIRGELLQTASRMEAEGQRIIKLNIGNPEPFGLLPPDEIVQDVAMNLHQASGYSDSKGIFAARKAVLQYYQGKGLLSATDVSDVFIGNGVSELIVMVMQALLDDGDEVLIPMPDYPLWTAAANLAGGRAVHYRCVEENDWQPDLADIESKITPRTKGIVVINPNNPTGALYSDEVLKSIADLAVKYGLVLMADEIYDRILYDGAVHTPMCTITDQTLVLTFNGLSKSHRIAGYRSGWVMISGKKDHATDFIEGLTMLASMRLCANVPAQYAIQTSMGGYQSMQALTAPNGRLCKQRDLAVSRLNAIKGISCTVPKGAFYCFAKIDREVYPIDNDMQFMMDLLVQEKVLMVQGTGFNWDQPDHFRVVFLPNLIDLEDAMDRLDRFFANKRKEFGTE